MLENAKKMDKVEIKTKIVDFFKKIDKNFIDWKRHHFKFYEDISIESINNSKYIERVRNVNILLFLFNFMIFLIHSISFFSLFNQSLFNSDAWYAKFLLTIIITFNIFLPIFHLIISYFFMTKIIEYGDYRIRCKYTILIIDIVFLILFFSFNRFKFE
jgi:hypothetical protein